MKVLIFNRSFFNFSETFIYKQVTGLPHDVEVALLGFNIINENIFPVNAKKYKLNKEVNVLDRLFTKILRRLTGRKSQLSVFNYLRVKRLLKREKVDLIHVHFGYNALLIYPIARELNIPIVVTFHGVDASPEFLKKSEYRAGIQKLLKYAREIIIVSPHMIETLQASQWKDKIHLIPCCVDPLEFVNHKAHADVGGRIRLLHSGRLVSKKGVPDLIKVCISLSKKYPQLQVDVIGDGPELPNCQKLVQEAAANNITFYGAKPFEEVKKFMSEADIFVLNSRTGETGDMEGTPVSLLEAMSMRLPVVSTYHAGIPQVITDGENGLLVHEKDNAALEAALEKLIGDAELRLKLGEAARTTVEEKFTIGEMNRKIRAVYDAVLGK